MIFYLNQTPQILILCKTDSTHVGWRVKENFPETFQSQLEKNKNVIHRPRSVRIGRNCALGLSNAGGHKTSGIKFTINLQILG